MCCVVSAGVRARNGNGRKTPRTPPSMKRWAPHSSENKKIHEARILIVQEAQENLNAPLPFQMEDILRETYAHICERRACPSSKQTNSNLEHLGWVGVGWGAGPAARRRGCMPTKVRFKVAFIMGRCCISFTGSTIGKVG